MGAWEIIYGYMGKEYRYRVLQDSYTAKVQDVCVCACVCACLYTFHAVFGACVCACTCMRMLGRC